METIYLAMTSYKGPVDSKAATRAEELCGKAWPAVLEASGRNARLIGGNVRVWNLTRDGVPVATVVTYNEYLSREAVEAALAGEGAGVKREKPREFRYKERVPKNQPTPAVPLFDAIFEELHAARTRKSEAGTLADALKWDRTARALESLRSRLRMKTFELQDAGLV